MRMDLLSREAARCSIPERRGRMWCSRTGVSDALPQATVTVIPDSGHFPHLRDPARFAECLARTATWTGKY
jgi:pimeloyl-ACP methyl ester carboxylesterase